MQNKMHPIASWDRRSPPSLPTSPMTRAKTTSRESWLSILCVTDILSGLLWHNVHKLGPAHNELMRTITQLQSKHFFAPKSFSSIAVPKNDRFQFLLHLFFTRCNRDPVFMYLQFSVFLHEFSVIWLHLFLVTFCCGGKNFNQYVGFTVSVAQWGKQDNKCRPQ